MKCKVYPELYHIDEHGNTRVWYMTQSENSYCTTAGIRHGKLVESAWTVAEPKNVGKKNETTGIEQAELEILAKYKKKKEQKYNETLDTAVRTNIIQPMLAIKWNDVKNKEEIAKNCYIQPKLDGFRAIATKDGLFSRTGKLIVSCPHINETLKDFFTLYPNAVLDGELYNHSLRDNFDELASLIGQKKPTWEDHSNSLQKIEYHVYDIFAPDSNQTFGFRSILLKAVENYFAIKLVSTIRCTSMDMLDDTYRYYLQEGYEGQMIRLDAMYEHKRSKNLIKRKEFFDAEYDVVSIVEGKGNWSGFAKSVLCRDKNGKEFSAGIKGTQEFTRELLNRLPMPKTCTVRSPNMTPDGIPRFGIAVMFFDDERDV
tara:strand:- start:992 stop:2104 length:1113 start_codon:yes stop_codon:yes gene_type:complete